MGYKHSITKISAIVILASSAIYQIPAYAAGFQINEISTSLQGKASAGAAAANNDVSSMFINPATLTTLLQNQFYIGGSEIIPRIHMSDASAIHAVNVPGIPPTQIAAQVIGDDDQDNISKGVFVPDAYLGWRINDRLVAGLAVVAPFGLTTHYSRDSVVRFAALDSSVQTLNINPAIAYMINNQWSVGVGLQAQYIRAKFSNFNGPYTSIPQIDSLISASLPTKLHGHDWGYGYNLGILYSPDACTRLGIGYRSIVSEQLHGEGEQYTSPGGVVPAPSQAFLFNAETSVHAGVKTPAVLTMSAARDYYDWTLAATAQLNFWNTFNHLSIYMPQAFATNSTILTKWKNSWMASVGADYRATSQWTLRGGIAYDQTPTSSTYRDPRIPDATRYWLNLGASYIMNKNFSVDGAYSHIFMLNQSVNVTQASGESINSTLPLEVNQVSAKYKGHADIIALALRYSF